MMEEVKELLHLIEKLPHMALWVLGGFALYKLITYASLVGSVTMILRLAIMKGFEAYALPKKPKTVEMEFSLNGLKMLSTVQRKLELMLMHLHDVRHPKGLTFRSEYLHDDDIDYLTRALADKINADLKAQTKYP